MRKSLHVSGSVPANVSITQRSCRTIRVGVGLAGLVVLVAVAGCASGADSGGAGTGVPAAGVGASAGSGTAMSGTGAAAGTGAVAGTSGGSAATFTAVLALLGQNVGNCGVCHAAAPSSANGSFMFNSADKTGAYSALVGKMSSGGSGSKCGAGKTYVVAGKPADSLLYQKLSASPACGVRMPQGGMPLTDAQLQTVSAWITAGAKND